jgi:hypothetical protein
MAFSEGISRLQRIIGFISTDYRNKKEIMAFLRNFNIIISYRTLERDLKQIKEVLDIEVEYKKGYGYKCESSKTDSNIIFSKSVFQYNSNELDIGFENDFFKVINVFEFQEKKYYNCLDKINNEIIIAIKNKQINKIS